jgi:hypothetical protein
VAAADDEEAVRDAIRREQAGEGRVLGLEPVVAAAVEPDVRAVAPQGRGGGRETVEWRVRGEQRAARPRTEDAAQRVGLS